MVVALGGVVQTAPADPDPSFRDLAREQLPRLLSIARRLVGDDAEDAVQDCLLKAFHPPAPHPRRRSGVADQDPGQLLP